MYMAASMAIGLATLGCGRYTLSTSNAAIAALLTALCPYWPRDPGDNKHHLQLLRHMYVLAVECRMLIPRALGPGLQFIALDVVVRDASDGFARVRAPIMIAELPHLRQLIVERSTATTRNGRQIIFDQRDAESWHTLRRLLHDGGELFVELDRRRRALNKDASFANNNNNNTGAVKRSPYEAALGMRNCSVNFREPAIGNDRLRMRREHALLHKLAQTQISELLMWMPHEWRCSSAMRAWHALFDMQTRAACVCPVDNTHLLVPLRDEIVLAPNKFAYLVELYAEKFSAYKKLLVQMDPFDVYWRFIYRRQRLRRIRQIQQQQGNTEVDRDELDSRPNAENDELTTMLTDDGQQQQLQLLGAVDRMEILNALGNGYTPKPHIPSHEQRVPAIVARRPLKRRKSSLPSIFDDEIEKNDDDEKITSASGEPSAKRLAKQSPLLAASTNAAAGVVNEDRPQKVSVPRRRSSVAGMFPVPQQTTKISLEPGIIFQTPLREKTKGQPLNVSTKSSKKSGLKLHLQQLKSVGTPRSRKFKRNFASSAKLSLASSTARRRFPYIKSLSQPAFASVDEEDDEDEGVADERHQKAAADISQSEHAFARLRFNPLLSRVLQDQTKVEAAAIMSFDNADIDDPILPEQCRSDIPFGQAYVHEKTLFQMQTAVGRFRPKMSPASAKDLDLQSRSGRRDLPVSWAPFEALFLNSQKSDKSKQVDVVGKTAQISDGDGNLTIESLQEKWRSNAHDEAVLQVQRQATMFELHDLSATSSTALDNSTGFSSLLSVADSCLDGSFLEGLVASCKENQSAVTNVQTISNKNATMVEVLQKKLAQILS